MGDVLQAAAALCLCKLACSLASVPWLGASHSPVSWCCCCLLLFTDVLVTVFLGFLYVFQPWLPELAGDVIALRSLLFLGHVYGEALLLNIPLIALDILARLLEPYGRRTGPAAGSAGRRRSGVTAERREEGGDSDTDQCLFHVGFYLCCLSVWVLVALNVKWRLGEAWPATCLHTTSSLISCLPRLFHPVPVVADPCRVMVFLLLLLLLLLLNMNTDLPGRRRAPAQADTVYTIANGGKGLAPAGSASTASRPAQSVDPGKTQSSCTLHREHFWNGVQMPTRHHGDAGKHKSTKGVNTFLPVAREDPQHMSHYRWGFPRRGASVLVALVAVLSTLVLPLNLSVNILVIRAVETLLELGVKSVFVSFASNTKGIPAFHNVMPV